MQISSNHRLSAYFTMAVSSIVGGGSLILFMLFLFFHSGNWVKLTLSDNAVLWWNTGLCLLFFAQHSCMIRRSFRRWLARLILPIYHGAIYSVASGTVLLLLLLHWQQSSSLVYDIQGTLRWFMRGIYLLAIAGTVWGLQSLGSFDSFGLSAIQASIRGQRMEQMPFVVGGPYRWVRHPLYLFMLLLIWSCPIVTADRLLFNCLFSAWIIAGTIFEERDLVSDFGEVYRNYQEHVPMLIPYRLRPFTMTIRL